MTGSQWAEGFCEGALREGLSGDGGRRRAGPGVCGLLCVPTPCAALSGLPPHAWRDSPIPEAQARLRGHCCVSPQPHLHPSWDPPGCLESGWPEVSAPPLLPPRPKWGLYGGQAKTPFPLSGMGSEQMGVWGGLGEHSFSLERGCDSASPGGEWPPWVHTGLWPQGYDRPSPQGEAGIQR